jgi:hypothetical protein
MGAPFFNRDFRRAAIRDENSVLILIMFRLDALQKGSFLQINGQEEEVSRPTLNFEGVFTLINTSSQN